MGKPTGFMEFDRLEKRETPIEERIKNFLPFHQEFSLNEQKEQASRCMNCGIPFCQSALKINGKGVGCPLSNLIPETNHLIYLGLYEEAFKRLNAVAPFPEFTGSVCPGLCEACCSCSINGSAVNIKANELFLIEEAFKNGWIKPNRAKKNGYKVAVVGSGPSGLACAKKLNDNGYSVTVYEKNDRYGGLLMYGIPNMKIDKSIVDRRINLLQDEGIIFVNNTHIGYDYPVSKLKEEYDAIVFACGTSLARPLICKNNEVKGVVNAVDFLTSTTKDLLDNKPFRYDLHNKNIIIVGGGDTGNDCVATSLRLGASSIYELEIMKEPPLENTLSWPNYPNKKKTDYGIKEANTIFNKEIRKYETTIDEIVGKESIEGIYIKKVKFENGKFVDIDNSREYLPCDLLIISMGFIGTKEEDLNHYGLNKLLSNTRLNNFKYDEKIYICGDMKNGQSLVVTAEKDGYDCAEEIINTIKL